MLPWQIDPSRYHLPAILQCQKDPRVRPLNPGVVTVLSKGLHHGGPSDIDDLARRSNSHDDGRGAFAQYGVFSAEDRVCRAPKLQTSRHELDDHWRRVRATNRQCLDAHRRAADSACSDGRSGIRAATNCFHLRARIDRKENIAGRLALQFARTVSMHSRVAVNSSRRVGGRLLHITECIFRQLCSAISPASVLKVALESDGFSRQRQVVLPVVLPSYA